MILKKIPTITAIKYTIVGQNKLFLFSKYHKVKR